MPGNRHPLRLLLRIDAIVSAEKLVYIILFALERRFVGRRALLLLLVIRN